MCHMTWWLCVPFPPAWGSKGTSSRQHRGTQWLRGGAKHMFPIVSEGSHHLVALGVWAGVRWGWVVQTRSRPGSLPRPIWGLFYYPTFAPLRL